MANAKMISLLRKLLSKTRESGLQWQEDPFEDAFYATIAGSAIYVKSIENKITIELRNTSGTILDNVSDDDSALEYEDRLSVRELFELARRYALGTDDVIDKVISELDDEIPF